MIEQWWVYVGSQVDLDQQKTTLNLITCDAHTKYKEMESYKSGRDSIMKIYRDKRERRYRRSITCVIVCNSMMIANHRYQHRFGLQLAVKARLGALKCRHPV